MAFPAKTKPKTLDLLWSHVVRRRDGDLCRHCRKNNGSAVHHIFSRRHKSTRWDPENGITLCFYCHIRIAHEDAPYFIDWVQRAIGQDRYDKLKLQAATPAGRIDYTLTEIYLRDYEKRVIAIRQTKPSHAAVVIPVR